MFCIMLWSIQCNVWELELLHYQQLQNKRQSDCVHRGGAILMYATTGNLRVLRHDYVINGIRSSVCKFWATYLCSGVVCWAPSNHLSSFILIHQWLYSPLLGPSLLFSFVIFFIQTVLLLGGGISPSQGRYLHTGQHKHRINADKHPYALSGIGTHDPIVLEDEDSSCLRPRGHYDRRSFVLYYLILKLVFVLSWITYINEIRDDYMLTTRTSWPWCTFIADIKPIFAVRTWVLGNWKRRGKYSTVITDEILKNTR
jgi:hypothetical protein